MPHLVRNLVLIAAGILGAIAVGLMVQERAPSARPPVTHKTIMVPAPSTGVRVRYTQNNYPQLALPDGRKEVVRSVLNITQPMHFGDFVWNEDRIPDGPVWVRVDLTRQLVSVFRGGHEIGSAVILFGTDGKPTPTGSFAILEKRADYHSRSYDAPMPFMLRLTDDGVALHGSNVRKGFATHGCVGIPLAFARLLFAATHKGDIVAILRS
jgi:L,D-transpeptidase-like protein